MKLLPAEIKQALLDINTSFKAVNKIDDAMTESLNKQHLKMGDYYELQRMEESIGYKVILYLGVTSDKALLIYRNYINICYEWMRIQLLFYNRLKDQQLNLIKLIERELVR